MEQETCFHCTHVFDLKSLTKECRRNVHKIHVEINILETLKSVYLFTVMLNCMISVVSNCKCYNVIQCIYRSQNKLSTLPDSTRTSPVSPDPKVKVHLGFKVGSRQTTLNESRKLACRAIVLKQYKTVINHLLKIEDLKKDIFQITKNKMNHELQQICQAMQNLDTPDRTSAEVSLHHLYGDRNRGHIFMNKLNIMTKARHKTEDTSNKMHNLVHALAVQNRNSAQYLEDCVPQAVILTIPNEAFLPSKEDYTQLN
ncbi:Hypothetical predicted protein [Mytilus galloprovincialis]|uniref:Uncharacterized protein n=1 Tax=Mytilus galloprovincialis TaxID=29158 RepID=A0A8B6D4W8_MYTGA|nr:Hypothetical predicted protein [Mytilus galloprovincialis]